MLARRWRPRRFEDLVGQPHVGKTILNGLRQGRMAHAYLFSGPRGVGKTTAARLVAHALNCLDPQNAEPCGKCDACKAITDGRFIDVIEIDAASNTGVDDIRKLREGIRYSPIEGKTKVYIVDEVHMLSSGAFNALLKTLEEPPDHAYFCLATTESQKIPATIISRCQRFDFRRVSVAELRGHLRNICESDSVQFEEEALDIIARKADGSVRDSLSLLDQVLAYAGGQVMKADATEVIGEVRLAEYFQAIDLVRSRSTAEAFKLDESLASSGTDPQDFLLGLESYLIQLLQAMSLGIEKVDIPQEARKDMNLAVDLLSENDVVRLLQLATSAEADVRRNFNPRVRVQLLLLKFAVFEQSVVLTEILKNLSGPSVNSQASLVRQMPAGNSSHEVAGKSNSAGNPQPKQKIMPNSQSSSAHSASPSTPVQSAPPVNQTPNLPDVPDNPLQVAQNAWKQICDKIIEKYNSRGRMIFHEGYPVEYVSGRLKINLTGKAILETARALQMPLSQEIQSFIGQATIEFQIGKLPERGDKQPIPDSDPAVKKLVERWNSKVIN